MQTYTKGIRIVPTLDLSLFKSQISEVPKGFGKVMEAMGKSWENVIENVSKTIPKIKKEVKEVSEISTPTTTASNDYILRHLDEYEEMGRGNSPQSFFTGLFGGEKRNEILELDEELQGLQSVESLLNDRIEELTKKLEPFEEIADTDIPDEVRGLRKELSKMTETRNEYSKRIKQTQEDKFQLETGGGPTKKGIENINWSEMGKKLGNSIQNKIAAVAQKYLDMWKEIITNMIDEFDRISQYSLDTSLRVNSEAREQALTYGLSNAQNYALTRTWEDMGIKDELDMLMMTPAQQEKFAEKMGMYSAQYQEMANEDMFKKYEEYLMARQEFQNEFEMQLIEFFVDNKDLIIGVMNFLMDALSAIMKAVSWIVDILGGDKEVTEKEKAAMVSDAINSYSISNSNSTNVKIDNSFTGVDLKDKEMYVRAGQQNAEQIINALDGRLLG